LFENDFKSKSQFKNVISNLLMLNRTQHW